MRDADHAKDLADHRQALAIARSALTAIATQDTWPTGLGFGDGPVEGPCVCAAQALGYIGAIFGEVGDTGGTARSAGAADDPYLG